jgi:aspartyl-tRNA(Asn)/glutamyl-tRNA(Gln) amidotransferase subunit C
MNVNNELIDRLSNLAKLEFNEQEKVAIATDLAKIISFIEKLQEVDTAGVTPLIYLNEDHGVMRADVRDQLITKKEALMNAPQRDSDYIKVPKVLQKK